MRCPRCDANVSDMAVRCNFCGQDLSIVHYVGRVSNSYYNMGLDKARVRDLSGAVTCLQKSLQFNKKNTDARNLLGLIYYEMGETVAALSEWVLSKYLQPEGNGADHYIDTIQRNQTALDATNQTIKKYNAALASAQAGNEDLAIIQLKKVVSLNPHFIRAQQLLALLYIYTNDFQRALKCLNRARNVDINNTMTLRYMREVGEHMMKAEHKGNEDERPQKKREPLANVTPVGTYQEEKRSMMPVVYVILGAILGVVVCFVLIRPTFQKSEAGGSDLSDANSRIAVQATQIADLEKEKEALNEEIKKAEKRISDADSKALKKLENYEKLLAGVRSYIANDKIQAALSVANCKKSDFDSEAAKKLYTTIGTISETQVAELVSRGRGQMDTSYDDAIATFKQVLSVDGDNQEAMFCMARCYQHQEKNKSAKKWYEKAIEIDGSTTFATQAKQYLEEVLSALGESTATAEP